MSPSNFPAKTKIESKRPRSRKKGERISPSKKRVMQLKESTTTIRQDQKNATQQSISGGKKHQHSIIVQCPRYNRKSSLPFPPLQFWGETFEEGGRRKTRKPPPVSSINSIMQSISQNQSTPQVIRSAISRSVSSFIFSFPFFRFGLPQSYTVPSP
jgi:hypothetical protein